MKYLFFLICIFQSVSFGAQLSQNDISILLPLPNLQTEMYFFRPDTKGNLGELLPQKIYDKMPSLVFEEPAETYKKLRVVGVRIDPCFPLEPPQIGCQPQVRMVWQPIVLDSLGSARSLDAALHTFYNLSTTDFSSLVLQLESLKSKYGIVVNDEPLSVNPTLKNNGVGGAYAKELFSIILSQVGESRLSQATFMQLSGGENVWIFGGFRILNGQATGISIPRVATFTQQFNNNPSFFSPIYFQNGGAIPQPSGADTFNLLIKNSRDITKADEPEVVESTMSAIRIENPNFHSPHTVDCVSCHVSQPARVWATRQYPWLYLEPQGDQFKFKSRFNLENQSPNQNHTKITRAFGYFGVDPAVSQRTINETAAALEKIYPK